jgi:hypothetical protein
MTGLLDGVDDFAGCTVDVYGNYVRGHVVPDLLFIHCTTIPAAEYFKTSEKKDIGKLINRP